MADEWTDSVKNLSEAGKHASETFKNLSSVFRDWLGIHMDSKKKLIDARTEMKLEEDRVRHKYSLFKLEHIESAKAFKEIQAIYQHNNLADVGLITTGFVPENTDASRINPHWLMQFADGAQNAGEDELKVIWAKILASEALRPGTYSKRSLQLLKSFSLEDGLLAKRVFSLAINSDQGLFIWTSAGYDANDIQPSGLTKYGFTNQEDLYLKEIGLMWENPERSVLFKRDAPTVFYYGGKKVEIISTLDTYDSYEGESYVQAENVPFFTQFGKELYHAIGAENFEFAQEYFDNWIEELKVKGFKLVIS